MSDSRLVNKNILIASCRTSMRLEPELWEALKEICNCEDLDLNELISRVDADRQAGGRTSAVRVFIVNYFRDRRMPADDQQDFIRFSPEAIQQMEKMRVDDPEAAAHLREMLANMRQAAQSVKDGQYSSFEDAMEAITGQRPRRVDDE